MKHIFYCLPLMLSSGPMLAQVSTTSVSFNNANAAINNNGTFFHQPSIGMPGYEVPANSNRNAIYFMNIAMAGEDINGQLKSAITSYDQSDYQPGPIASDYNDPAYVATYATALWSVSKAEIEAHITGWHTQGYVTPASIANWPGNGHAGNGEAAILAPYYDGNGNGIYEPASGEYPIIRGDYAVYSIVNDQKVHPSGGQAIGMEIHLMFYQYLDSANAALSNTTFIHAQCFNRSSQTLYNFKVGSFIDYDLGNYADDYAGCDTIRNVSYCYNGDLNDEFQSGHPGYGEYPPAIGIQYLNRELYSHIANTNGSVNNPDPAIPVQMNYALSGLTATGAAIVDPFGQTTRFQYNSLANNGWSEFAPTTNPSGDRRIIIGVAPFTLLPQSDFCVDMAVLYATNTDSTIAGAPLHLLAVADEIQNFYDQQGYNCEMALSVEEKQLTSIQLYPNPASDVLHIMTNSGIAFRILSSDGKTLFVSDGSETSVNIASFANGYYLFQSEDGQIIPFVKQ